jgi:hypothetical protein
MNYLELKDTAEKEPFIYSSSNKTNEVIVEDAPDLSNEMTGLDTFTSKVPPNTGEDRWEERVPLRLFVYGVSHHPATLTNECN